MITIVFGLIMITHGFVCAYFGWRLLKKWRRFHVLDYRALICTVMPIGWILAPARELKLIHRPPTTWLLGAGLTVGVLCVWIIFHWESQRA